MRFWSWREGMEADKETNYVVVVDGKFLSVQKLRRLDRRFAVCTRPQSSEWTELVSKVSCWNQPDALYVIEMVKRSIRPNLQIMAEILDHCRQPRTKTQVMYRANLSWQLNTRYLSFLTSCRLLEVHHSRAKYATTGKGLQFVEKWEELTELLSWRNLRLNVTKSMNTKCRR